MHELEGFADVELTTKESGIWAVPPYFIDSVAHLAGFTMNCSDAIDTQSNYCVTPGWDSMRFAKPLVPGGKYHSYVKMVPTVEDPIYFGDVYGMQDNIIIGVVNGIQFRRYPRILLSRFLSPPDKMAAIDDKPKPAAAQAITIKSRSATPMPNRLGSDDENISPPTSAPAPSKGVAAAAESPSIKDAAESGSITAKAILLIANETGLDLSEMTDDAGFGDLDIDSLMSLVIAEKFRTELNIKVNGSLFLDYETIGDLREWLGEYYN
ncbi:hypothetical protein TSTA_100440 [Talaromyces stipitatus ATCC 10500]|uniref:Uncharacterized protein n=1 Tax=Talaromyces stipitatus (strain ATCC 10500 / CBS 375.48 / QM 6759 / NRRL 1006) TaxID=441959 RepID=B8MLT2_TALSN|nr:uncharacterized protein TSTA_100440 [Talaromyces stipitatus ATCC 10500]EED13799.1 hypothetical protein TSTA_100440 [Talaromyces stipitatus ATCC 10500]